jgi:cell division septation protein DedD
MNKPRSAALIQWGILALGITSLILFFHEISDHGPKEPVSSSTLVNEEELLNKTRMGSRLSFPMPDRPINTLSSAQSKREPLIPSLPLDRVALEKEPNVSRNLSKATPIISNKPAEPNSQKEQLVYHSERAFFGWRVSSYPYSISLGSFKTLDNAQKTISIFQEKGMVPYWVKVDLGTKGLWFRVFAGHFRTREETDTFIKNNKIVDGKSRHTKYANLIGTYSSKAELEEMRLRLLKLGYYPYVIGGTDAVSFLFAGAFYQWRRADKQRAELASKGISSEVVER